MDPHGNHLDQQGPNTLAVQLPQYVTPANISSLTLMTRKLPSQILQAHRHTPADQTLLGPTVIFGHCRQHDVSLSVVVADVVFCSHEHSLNHIVVVVVLAPQSIILVVAVSSS